MQVRGVRPFFSEKYDITRHPRYKYLSDADKKNTFDVDSYLSSLRRKKRRVVTEDEPFDLYDIELSEEDFAAEYAAGTHPPIIAKETFEQVQKLILLRKEVFGKKKKEHSHPLSKKLICGNCGTVFRRKLQRKHAYWCCMKHDTSLTDCAMLPIAEESIYDAFCRLYYKLKHQSNSIFGQMLTSLQAIRNQRMLWSPDIVSLNKKISELSSQNQTLVFLKQQGLVDPDIFISQTNELTKQLRQAKLEKEKLMDAESDMTAQQTQEILDLLENGPDFLDTFDAELFGELVDKIIVENSGSIRFRLKNGLELRERIERTVR